MSAQATDSDGDAGNTADADGHDRERRADGRRWPRRNDLSVERGLDAHLQLHDHAIRARTRSARSRQLRCQRHAQSTRRTRTRAGSFDCTFPDGPASSTVSAQATDSDGDAGNTATQTVTVNNVAPTVTLAAGTTCSVNEGSTHTYSYTITRSGSGHGHVGGDELRCERRRSVERLEHEHERQRSTAPSRTARPARRSRRRRPTPTATPATRRRSR